jgi:hypothetical protein
MDNQSPLERYHKTWKRNHCSTASFFSLMGKLYIVKKKEDCQCTIMVRELSLSKAMGGDLFATSLANLFSS